MQRKSIKAGVIYAITSPYAQPSPIVFLEDGAAGLYTRDRYGSRIRPVPESSTTKARAGRGFDPSIGYAAVVTGSLVYGTEKEAAIEAMRTIDPAAELDRFKASARPAAEMLQFKIIASLGKITEWDQATAAYEAGREADRRRDAERAERNRRTQAAVAALKGHGFLTARRTVESGSEGVAILIDDAERLLEMLASLRTADEG